MNSWPGPKHGLSSRVLNILGKHNWKLDLWGQFIPQHPQKTDKTPANPRSLSTQAEEKMKFYCQINIKPKSDRLLRSKEIPSFCVPRWTQPLTCRVRGWTAAPAIVRSPPACQLATYASHLPLPRVQETPPAFRVGGQFSSCSREPTASPRNLGDTAGHCLDDFVQSWLLGS